MALEIKFSKFDNTPWGFRLTGGSDYGMPLTVVKVSEKGLAAKSGLKEKDVIVKINDIQTNTLSHDGAHEVILLAGNNFVATVLRAETKMSNFEICKKSTTCSQPEIPVTDISTVTNGVQPIPMYNAKVNYSTKVYKPFSDTAFHDITPLESPLILSLVPKHVDGFQTINQEEWKEFTSESFVSSSSVGSALENDNRIDINGIENSAKDFVITGSEKAIEIVNELKNENGIIRPQSVQEEKIKIIKIEIENGLDSMEHSTNVQSTKQNSQKTQEKSSASTTEQNTSNKNVKIENKSCNEQKSTSFVKQETSKEVSLEEAKISAINAANTLSQQAKLNGISTFEGTKMGTVNAFNTISQNIKNNCSFLPCAAAGVQNQSQTDTLLKTFFVHLTDVMVALTHMITSEDASKTCQNACAPYCVCMHMHMHNPPSTETKTEQVQSETKTASVVQSVATEKQNISSSHQTNMETESSATTTHTGQVLKEVIQNIHSATGVDVTVDGKDPLEWLAELDEKQNCKTESVEYKKDEKSILVDNKSESKMEEISVESKQIEESSIETKQIEEKAVEIQHVATKAIESMHVEDTAIESKHIEKIGVEIEQIEKSSEVIQHMETSEIISNTNVAEITKNQPKRKEYKEAIGSPGWDVKVIPNDPATPNTEEYLFRLDVKLKGKLEDGPGPTFKPVEPTIHEDVQISKKPTFTIGDVIIESSAAKNDASDSTTIFKTGATDDVESRKNTASIAASLESTSIEESSKIRDEKISCDIEATSIQQTQKVIEPVMLQEDLSILKKSAINTDSVEIEHNLDKNTSISASLKATSVEEASIIIEEDLTNTKKSTIKNKPTTLDIIKFTDDNENSKFTSKTVDNSLHDLSKTKTDNINTINANDQILMTAFNNVSNDNLINSTLASANNSINNSTNISNATKATLDTNTSYIKSASSFNSDTSTTAKNESIHCSAATNGFASATPITISSINNAIPASASGFVSSMSNSSNNNASLIIQHGQEHATVIQPVKDNTVNEIHENLTQEAIFNEKIESIETKKQSSSASVECMELIKSEENIESISTSTGEAMSVESAPHAQTMGESAKSFAVVNAGIQKIANGLDNEVNGIMNGNFADEELGKPGLPDEEIAEIISGHAQEVKDQHVIGLQKVIASHMNRPDDEINVNGVPEMTPLVGFLRDSEVFKALNEENLKLKAEREKEEQLKWTKFLQKPNRPIPYCKRLADQLVFDEPPYKVNIKKQPKKDSEEYTSSILTEGVFLIPEVPILIPEPTPLYYEAPEFLADSSFPDLEDTGVPIPIVPKADEIKLDTTINEADKTIIEENTFESQENQIEENTEMMTEEKSWNDANIMEEPIDENLSMEEQLAKVQQQLVALSRLPATIQQTLDQVTKQLSKMVPKGECEPKKTEVEEEMVIEETPEADKISSEIPQEDEIQTQNHEENKTNHENGFVEEHITQNGTDAHEIVEDIQEVVEKVPAPCVEAVKEGNTNFNEQMKIDKIKKDLIDELSEEHVMRQVKQRPGGRVGRPRPAFGPLVPQERPIVLPGGRRWRGPRDALTDSFIAETLSGQAELIMGKALGVNFMKYNKPPVALDHLKNSSVFKMIHDMDEPIHGIHGRPPIVLAESEYREKCRSVTPSSFDKQENGFHIEASS